MMDFLKIVVPSLISVTGVILVAIINMKGARQKRIDSLLKEMRQSQEKIEKDLKELKGNLKETHTYINEIVNVLTTAFNEHKDKGQFNGETTKAIREMQTILINNAINKINGGRI